MPRSITVVLWHLVSANTFSATCIMKQNMIVGARWNIPFLKLWELLTSHDLCTKNTGWKSLPPTMDSVVADHWSLKIIIRDGCVELLVITDK